MVVTVHLDLLHVVPEIVRGCPAASLLATAFHIMNVALLESLVVVVVVDRDNTAVLATDGVKRFLFQAAFSGAAAFVLVHTDVPIFCSSWQMVSFACTVSLDSALAQRFLWLWLCPRATLGVGACVRVSIALVVATTHDLL